MIDRTYETLVFLGPSCPIDKALKVLPDGHYLPPVKCGDILQALRLKPRRIAIIDGLFTAVPTVWHKEILFAMEKGVEVWGAASMGALRAAELHMHGMIGFGKVFSSFRDNQLTDDDEVAIVYYQDGDSYVCVTDAMVNVRATLQLAIDQSIVPLEYAEVTISKLKEVHFTERHLGTLLKETDDDASKNFINWLSAGNYVNVKEQDAIGLLLHLRDSPAPRYRSAITTRRTLSLRRLNLRIMTAPLDFSVGWLPEHERKLQSLLDRPYFNSLRRLAYFLALYDSWLKVLQIETADELQGGISVRGSGSANGTDAHRRVCQLKRLFANSAKHIKNPDGSWHGFYLCCLKLEDAYTRFKRDYNLDMTLYAKHHPTEHRILYLLAHLWWFYQNYLHQRQFEPQAERIHKQTIDFRRRHRLWSEVETEAWLTENDLDPPGMYRLMTMECNYRYLVEGCFYENLGFVATDEDCCWLSDALTIVESDFEGSICFDPADVRAPSSDVS